ncbi:DUF5060 domain-containing protein [Balneolales bacterium ANBcel1]|nr:DUF5060 domain-containing protein [Balneolales bacterium ANBcel1]
MLSIITASWLSLLLATAVPALADSPLSGFFDTFDRPSPDTVWNGEVHPLWQTSAPQTYQLATGDGALVIEYTRTGQSGANDGFTFTPPRPIDASETPRVYLTVRSDIDTEMTIRARYSRISIDDHVIDIPGDGVWHTRMVRLGDHALSQTLDQMLFYLDRGTTAPNDGTVEFRDFRVAGPGIRITGLEAQNSGAGAIRLQWGSDNPDALSRYHIHRSTDRHFEASEANLVGTSETGEYLDENLEINTFYHYRVNPVDTLGGIHPGEREIRFPAFDPAVTPGVSVSGSFPAGDIRRYEPITISATIRDAVYENPYDPDEIDLRATFYAPSGDTFQVFGFYNGAPEWNTWMIRFSPMETGNWEYRLHVSDMSGSDQSETRQFTAVASEHPGMLTISPDNPSFLMHHDSTSFYGLAVYYPWSVSQTGLDRFREYGGNIFGYWNSTYDGGGNQGGRYLLMSNDSGLGYIDERKAARIDEVLEWSEARDMYVMLAIWPHDWLRIRGTPWNVEHSRWLDENPFSELFTPEEFYTSEEAWEIQEKLYRYIIARWGHSRAMGIWELINEIHGTTGFVHNEPAAVEWTNRMHRYFREYDHYNRPTTASYGSIDIYNRRDIQPDIVNRHYYEAQGGYSRPYGDAVRDGLYNITNAYRQMIDVGERPAVLGEAGYYTMFAEAGSDEYTREFHNAFWAGAAMGMATTPFWWDYTQNAIFTNERMEIYRNLERYVRDINYALTPFTDSGLSGESTKAFGLSADTVAIGWLWTTGSDISGMQARQNGLQNGSFETAWYDTRTGDVVRTVIGASVDNTHPLLTTSLPDPQPDIAFKTRRIENGTDASRLNLFFRKADGVSDNGATDILLYVSDAEGRLVPGEENGYQVDVTLDGAGSLSATRVVTTDGYAVITYEPDPGAGGTVVITVEADGLEPAELVYRTATSAGPEHLDEAHPGRVELHGNYPNPFNASTVIQYALPEAGQVILNVYDALGREVRRLVDGYQEADTYSVTFDGTGLPSGLYIFRLRAPGYADKSRAMLLVK